jgi:anti-sigma regulatory factor (Ser/Thr protein kinase)
MASLRRQVSQTFAHTPREIARARHLVGAHLDEWGLGDVRGELELVVGELLTNAVRHGAGTIRLHLSTDDTTIHLDVSDEGGGQPHLRPVERNGGNIGGWGLRMVDQLVDAWGTDVHPGRTVVWVERSHT